MAFPGSLYDHDEPGLYHNAAQAEDANIVFQPAVSADESGLLCSSGDTNVVDAGNRSDMSLVASLVVDENQASQQQQQQQ
jgi:hypothetical protein